MQRLALFADFDSLVCMYVCLYFYIRLVPLGTSQCQSRASTHKSGIQFLLVLHICPLPGGVL